MAATYPRKPPQCVSAGRLQLRSKKLIERFLFAVLPKPQGFASIQVTDHGDELHLLAEVNLIHPHLG
jgi:hypothetical protein